MAASLVATPPVAHFCQDLDLSLEKLKSVLKLAADMKRTPQRYAKAMDGKYLALLFEKPSLRTAVGFELAIKQMGGDSVMANGTMGQREPVKDMAPQVVPHKLFAQIRDVTFLRARRLRLLLQARQLLAALTHVAAHRDHFATVVLFQPRNDDGCIQAARVGERYLLRFVHNLLLCLPAEGGS